jgi:hypothetical protein
MALALSEWHEVARSTQPIKHVILERSRQSLVQLGWPREPFSGTDTLGYSAINQIEAWLPSLVRETPLLVAEGDRLANDRFMDDLKSVGQLDIVYLDTPVDVAQERRERRAKQHGLELQNPSWVAGRATKAANLALRHNATTIDGTMPLEEQAKLLREVIGG